MNLVFTNWLDLLYFIQHFLKNRVIDTGLVLRLCITLLTQLVFVWHGCQVVLNMRLILRFFESFAKGHLIIIILYG